jgi:3-deoxy-D-manno-octulosonic-acid transferase
VLWLYRLLFLPVFCILLPAWVLHMYRRGGYGAGFLQRLGIFPRLPDLPPHRRRLWIHGVSVGEIQMLRPLIEKLLADERYDIVLTSTSSSGLRLARERYDQVATVLAFPLDFWPFSLRAWNRIRPTVLLHGDGELWPEHIHRARSRSVPVLIANGRISARSFRRHRRFRFLSGRLWNAVTEIYPDGPASADRLLRLHVGRRKIFQLGNLKCDRMPFPPLAPKEREDMLQELGICPSGPDGRPTPLLIGCSTWPGEEEFLLDVLERLRKLNPAWRLLLAPRHGERRDELQKLLKDRKFSYHLRSGGPAAEGKSVVVLDTVGELAQLIRVGTVAFIGKTFPPNDGGQSPLDAVAASVPAVCGPNCTNFRDMVDGLVREGAMFLGKTANEVANLLDELAAAPERRKSMARAGAEWLRNNGGAAGRICERIELFAFGIRG